MIGRRTTAGLTLLCALMFCAFAAQSALAQKGTHATNTTAFTCVKVGANKGDFKDEHCDEKVGEGKGSFAHKEFPKSKDTTTIEVTNEKTSDDTTKAYSAILTAIHLGVNVEITCEIAKSKAGGKNWIQNVEKEGKHTVEGTVEVEFSKCKVLKPAQMQSQRADRKHSQIQRRRRPQIGSGKKKTMGVEFTEDGANFADISLKTKAPKNARSKEKRSQ